MATPPDFTTGQVLTAAMMDKIGLWLIETKDVTATATIDFTSVFDADYRGYRLMWDYTQNTTGADLYLQFRNASGVIASNYFWQWGGTFVTGTTAYWAGWSQQIVAQSNTVIGALCAAANRTSGWLDLPNPQNGGAAYGHGQSYSLNANATYTHVTINGGILHNASTTRTGLRLTCNAGTMTGKFSLYGYRN